MSVPATWKSLANATDVPRALFDHLSPVLGTTSNNRDALERVCAVAKHITLDTSDDDERYHQLIVDFGSDKLRLSVPQPPDEARTVSEGFMPAPPSYRRILDLHSRMQLADAQVDMFYENYIEAEGWLDGTDLAEKGVFCPLRVYSDIYIYHPSETTPEGEPALYFLDHEVVEDDGPQRAEGDIAAVFLRHIAKSLKV